MYVCNMYVCMYVYIYIYTITHHMCVCVPLHSLTHFRPPLSFDGSSVLKEYRAAWLRQRNLNHRPKTLDSQILPKPYTLDSTHANPKPNPSGSRPHPLPGRAGLDLLHRGLLAESAVGVLGVPETPLVKVTVPEDYWAWTGFRGFWVEGLRVCLELQALCHAGLQAHLRAKWHFWLLPGYGHPSCRFDLEQAMS